LGVESAANYLGLIQIISSLLLVPLAVASVAALLIRFVGSRGDERAQLKWFFYVAALFLLYAIYGTISDALGVLPSMTGNTGTFVFASFLALFAIAVGIAILKYHLYEIDVIIRKSLVYGVLTVLLALAYFGGVALLETVLSVVSGQRSTIAIVISTLGIAALFTPLRGGIQAFIDRRFYRKKYDAERVLASFATLARDEVDFDELANALLRAVEETMEPVRAKIWLK
jgi:hypothetical protein